MYACGVGGVWCVSFFRVVSGEFWLQKIKKMPDRVGSDNFMIRNILPNVRRSRGGSS